jgi:hypothetical protein
MGSARSYRPLPQDALPPPDAVRDWIREGLSPAGGECHRSFILSEIASQTGLPAGPDLEDWRVGAFEAEALAGAWRELDARPDPA